ncbi:MAG: PepSY domain-containing protein [Sphingobacteriales bacterium]|nr:PepSY domain-containing protein [Sphingobacteriales bacterium]
MKKLFRSIHLYLSLAAGIFIILACVTGSIMVFEDEINHLIYSKRYFVKAQKEKPPIDELIKYVENHKEGFKVTGVKVYNKPNRSLEVSISPIEKEKEKPITKEPQRRKENQFTVYINPYTGQILDLVNGGGSFFKKVEMLHRFLLGRKGGVGHYIMRYSATFFLFIIATGLVLWWPKSKAILKQRLKVKWDGSTKRLMHDLHVVVGFYTSLFLIIIVMTGLVMSFNWLNKGLFVLTHSSPQHSEPPKSKMIKDFHITSIDQIQENLGSKLDEAQEYSIRFPQKKDAAFQINVLDKNVSPNAINTYYANQYNGEIIGNLAFADKNLGQKIRSYIKPIHTGEVYGLTTKILNFIIILLTLTFPVTGVIMWLNRLKKQSQKSKPITSQKQYPLKEIPPIH